MTAPLKASSFKRGPLVLQYIISRVFILLLYWGLLLFNFFFLRYRIRDIRSLRQQFKKIVKDSPGPILICPNHLTFIDSPLIMWATASPWTYLTRFHCCPWNLPKASHVKSNFFFRLVCYVGKCILMPDQGSSQEIKVAMHKLGYLLDKGQYIMLFPEGTRSRSGRVNTEDIGYGVGQLIANNPKTQVLCLYIRGDNQPAYSNFPQRGEQINISMQLIHPTSALQGRRAHRDLSIKIIQTIAEMERQYFEQHL